MNRRQQRHRHAQPQDPSERGKQRHVHVIEHEHLIAEHGQPIEILRAFLMRDRRDRCLQLRDVRFERDRHLVAEAPLHARADGAEKPRRGGRHAEANRRALHHPGPVLEDAFAEQHQPQRKQRIGQRGELRQHERHDHQARLVAIPQFAQSPHRRQRGRQRLNRSASGRAISIRRGRHTSCPPLLRNVETLCLQIEHRPIAPAERHQFVVRAELDDSAVLEHADAIGMADGGEAMRDQNGRAMPRRGEQAIEDFRFAAHVELRGRLVEQHDAGAELDGCQRPGERDALPLAARQIGAAVVPAGKHRVQCGQVRRSRGLERRAHDIVWRACRRHVVAQRQLEADEVLEHGRDARAPRREIELANVHAVDLDRAGLRIVQPAQQLRDRRLAGAVLSNDGERRAGGNREIEVLQHWRAAGIRERDIAQTNLARRCSRPRGDRRSAARLRDASPAPVAAPRRRGLPLRRAPN